MNNSMKLSYDMIFANGSSGHGDDTATAERPSSYSAEEVDKMLEERDDRWQQRLETECDEARESGFKAGYEEGRQQAESTLDERFAALKEITDELDAEFKRTFEELKPHIAGLVFTITEKVLDIPVEDERLQQRVQQEVMELVESLDESLQIRVKLSEADYEMVQRALDGKTSIENVTLRVDQTQMPGEYEIETGKEYIIKNFKKMVADFKESISFAESDTPEFDT